MSWKREIRLAGFGGQGIVLSGHILGRAAAIHEKKNAVFTQSYGPEARGGSCSADVIVSDTRVHYPKVGRPHVLVLMSQGALNTYGGTMRDDGVMIVDEDLVKIDAAPPGTTLYRVPFTRMAEDLGRRIVANIVMLGSLTALGEVVSYQSMKEAVLSSIPKGTEELNIAAFDKGYEYAMELLEREGGDESARKTAGEGS